MYTDYTIIIQFHFLEGKIHLLLDSVGTQYWWMTDYRDVLFSEVIDTTWVWLTAIFNDVM